MRLSIVLSLLLLLSCNGASSPTDPDGPVAFTEVLRDQQSGIIIRRTEVVANATRWGQVWDEIMSTRSPKPPLPTVDFDNNLLILAARGETADACKSIEIDGVQRVVGRLEVSVAETSRPPSCSCPPVTVKPVHIVAVKRQARGISYSFHEVVKGPGCT